MENTVTISMKEYDELKRAVLDFKEYINKTEKENIVLSKTINFGLYNVCTDQFIVEVPEVLKESSAISVLYNAMNEHTKRIENGLSETISKLEMEIDNLDTELKDSKSEQNNTLMQVRNLKSNIRELERNLDKERNKKWWK